MSALWAVDCQFHKDLPRLCLLDHEEDFPKFQIVEDFSLSLNSKALALARLYAAQSKNTSETKKDTQSYNERMTRAFGRAGVE